MAVQLTAHGPEDLLAAVPVVLGFRPSGSVVMLTFGGRHPFHARVDLPEPDAPGAALRDLADTLLRPVLVEEVERVAFVVYTSRPRLAARAGRRLVRSFTRSGVEVVAVLRADGARWTLVPGRPGEREGPSCPYDDRTHPFAAQAVLDGRVTRATRDDLRATLAPDPGLRRRTELALLALPPPVPDEAARVLLLLRGCAADHRPPTDAEAARVLRAVPDVGLRDAVVCSVPRETAARHLDLWSGLLRRAADPQVPDAAAITAFCAWRAGDGALAWCALDRCLEVDPHHRLGLVLAECLVRAVPPSAWDEHGGSDRAGPRDAHGRPGAIRRDRP